MMVLSATHGVPPPQVEGAICKSFSVFAAMLM